MMHSFVQGSVLALDWQCRQGAHESEASKVGLGYLVWAHGGQGSSVPGRTLGIGPHPSASLLYSNKLEMSSILTLVPFWCFGRRESHS